MGSPAAARLWGGDSPICAGFLRKLAWNDDLGCHESHRRIVDFFAPDFRDGFPGHFNVGDLVEKSRSYATLKGVRPARVVVTLLVRKGRVDGQCSAGILGLLLL